MALGTRIDLPGQQDPEAPGRIGRVRWTICAMLFVATSINYMDRQVISILKPTLEHSIGMTEIGYGYVVSAFQFAYALGLLAAGRFVDKVGTRIGYIVIMAIWSLSAMGHALANTVLEFGIARFCLGIGESGNFPAAIKTVAEWFPQTERSLATGIFNSGTNLGAILAPIIVPWVTIHYGWHAAFLVTGAFSAIWIVLWYSKYRKPADHPTLTGAELRHIYQEAAEQMGPSTPWIKLLGLRQTWAFTLGKFLTDPVWWFYLFWLPDYLHKQFGMTKHDVMLPTFIVYGVAIIGSVYGGSIPMTLIKRGIPVYEARMTAMLIIALFPLTVLTTQYFGNVEHFGNMAVVLAVATICIGAAAHQAWSANLFTTVSDMFPKKTVASVTGIGTMAGGIGGGVILQLLAGRLTDHFKQTPQTAYLIMFIICALSYLIAWTIMKMLVPRHRPITDL